jgi:phenylalanyl-tRNA synthetase beta chain
MRAVWSWLLDLVDLPDDVGPDEAAAALTGAGLEVEEIEAIGSDFSGVVVAEVVGKRRHPEADRLTLVEVIDRPGGSKWDVICGAPNVPEPGGRVLWARPGARLPDGLEIQPRALKGVLSHGMLCSERELKLSDTHEGIYVLGEEDAAAQLGAQAQDALALRDIVFDIGVPANRPDANGHLGLARELAALCKGRLRPVECGLADITDDRLDAANLVRVRIEDRERCSRYVARIIDGLTVKPSPRWMRRRLDAVGVRPLSNLIDVTNYVMFELGQPLHAFDYARVAGGTIVVRRAHSDEALTTLDAVERTLTSDDLLICDQKGPVALAGVMGGANSEVDDRTTRVLLESAHFEPTGVRRTARRTGLHSESSHRFERGVDPNGADRASARAARLLAQLGGGRVARGAVDEYPVPARPMTVAIRPARAAVLTGVPVTAGDVRRALSSIELEVSDGDGGAVQVEVPTFRPDVTREVDLIEEVLRLHGFDKVPATMPRNDIAPLRRADTRVATARTALAGAGMLEAITFAFTSPERIAALRLPEGDPRRAPIALRNPLRTDHSVMRTSLLSNLLSLVALNLSRGNHDLAVFEVGSVFLANPDGPLPYERRTAAGVLCGRGPSWMGSAAALDFFDAKGIVETLVGALTGRVRGAGSSLWSPAETAPVRDVPYLHPGVSAEIVLRGATGRVGVVGEVHPEVRTRFDIGKACFVFELDLEHFAPCGPAQLQELPRYPATTRDVSFFVDEQVPAARVREIIRRAGAELLEQVEILEDYRDPAHVPSGKKGMLWSVTYRSSERTLTDDEADQTHEALVQQLLRELPAQRR